MYLNIIHFPSHAPQLCWTETKLHELFYTVVYIATNNNLIVIFSYCYIAAIIIALANWLAMLSHCYPLAVVFVVNLLVLQVEGQG